MASRSRSRLPTDDEAIAELIASAMKGHAARAAQSLPPSKVNWAIGDEAKLGSLDEVKVVHVFDEGRRLVVRAVAQHPRHGEQVRFMVRPWFELQKPELVQATSFARTNDVPLHFQSGSVEDLLSKKFNFGVDDSPVYQRGLVWTLEDKQRLIDSMFNNVDIGKFLLIDLEYAEDRASYEILDGKQRLDALSSFVGDGFAYQGVYFSQMSRRDRNFFEDFPVQMARFPEKSLTWEQTLRLFLRVNTTGHAQSDDHLAMVKGLLQHAQEASALSSVQPTLSRSAPRP